MVLAESIEQHIVESTQQLERVVRRILVLSDEIQTTRIVRVDHCEVYLRRLFAINRELRATKRRLLQPIFVESPLTLVDLIDILSPTELRMNMFAMYFLGILTSEQMNMWQPAGVPYYTSILALHTVMDLNRCGEIIMQTLNKVSEQLSLSTPGGIVKSAEGRCADMLTDLQYACRDKIYRRDRVEILRTVLTRK